MRKSSIQLVRISRKNSFEQSASLTQESTLDRATKTEFGQKLKQLKKVATQKKLYNIEKQRVQQEQIKKIFTEPNIQQEKNLNIPQYEFLQNCQQIQTDPFLRAKMKYLLTKQRPLLVKQMPKVKPFYSKKNQQPNIQNEGNCFTTLRRESKKQNKKKLYLLTVGNLNTK